MRIIMANAFLVIISLPRVSLPIAAGHFSEPLPFGLSHTGHDMYQYFCGELY